MRLDQVEFRLVRLVKVLNLLIGDIDLRLNLFIQELGLGQIPPNVALQVVQRHVALLEQVVELILGVRSFDLGELRVHVFIAGGQVQLGRLLLLNLGEDHLLQDIEPQDVRFLVRRLLGVVTQLDLVIPLQFRARNLLAVDRGHHVR